MRIFNRFLPAVALAALVSAPASLLSQEPDREQAEASRKIRSLLDSHMIDTTHFAEPMPLAKFLNVLERQLPQDKRITLRIEKEAFGEKFAEVAATTIKVPPYPKSMYASTALRLAMSQMKVDRDYRCTAGEFVITTPERAQYTAEYNLSAVVEKPENLRLSSPIGDPFRENQRLRQLDSTGRAELLVQAIASHLDLTPDNGTRMQILNGNRLVIRTNATKHELIESMPAGIRRLGDLWVVAKSRLYEVDDAFYAKVKSAKRASRKDVEEEEQRLLNGLPPKHESLFKFLRDHKLALEGDDVKVDSGFEATLLSKHQVLSCLPSPEQIRKGQKNRQAVLEGIAFVGGIHISSDRRYLRIKLTEKAAELDVIEKQELVVDNEGNRVAAETPVLKEIIHVNTRDIPDGSSILLPVHYRPRELRDKNRWWVLTITPRIIIPEEEELIQYSRLEATLPLIVADILKNPRLKATREFYGSANDKRFALVNSAAWSWPKEPKLDTPGYQLTPAYKIGRRMLGIRVERINDEITVNVVNAGGSENGAVVGSGTLRYTTRETEKGWTVRLAE